MTRLRGAVRYAGVGGTTVRLLLGAVCVTYAAVAPPTAFATDPCITWELASGLGPTEREFTAMAYDSARDVHVLFGGEWGTQVYGDTWEFDGVAWTQVTTAQAPSPRFGHAMAYDSTRGVVVLFGGGASSSEWLSDTWEFDGSGWTQVSSGDVPGRKRSAMAFDSARSVTVLFGGSGPLPWGNVDDTWEWNGATWTDVSPASSPPARDKSAMAFDSARGVSVLFGGRALAEQDTWEWNGQTWALVADGVGPAGRHGHMLAFDSAREKTILYGGCVASLDDLWEWNGQTWASREVGAVPGFRCNASMSYDSIRHEVLVFGNSHLGANQLWRLRFGRPAILQQPVDTVAVESASAVLGVSLFSYNALAFEWFKDGLPISGPNDAILSIPSVSPDDAGIYEVRVVGTCGDWVHSAPAALSVRMLADLDSDGDVDLHDYAMLQNDITGPAD